MKLHTVNKWAELLGHDRRSMKKWLADSAPVGEQDGFPTYDAETVRTVVKRHLEARKPTDKAKARLVELQCEQLEVKIALLRKQLVTIVNVERWVGEIVGEAKKVLLSGPSGLAPQVVGETIPEAERILSQWVHNALQQLHEQPAGAPNPEEIADATIQRSSEQGVES